MSYHFRFLNGSYGQTLSKTCVFQQRAQTVCTSFAASIYVSWKASRSRAIQQLDTIPPKRLGWRQWAPPTHPCAVDSASTRWPRHLPWMWSQWCTMVVASRPSRLRRVNWSAWAVSFAKSAPSVCWRWDWCLVCPTKSMSCWTRSYCSLLGAPLTSCRIRTSWISCWPLLAFMILVNVELFTCFRANV